MEKKYYLEGDLFYKSKGVAGYAQIPHCFTESHINLLNSIVWFGTAEKDRDGQRFYTIDDKYLKVKIVPIPKKDGYLDYYEIYLDGILVDSAQTNDEARKKVDRYLGKRLVDFFRKEECRCQMLNSLKQRTKMIMSSISTTIRVRLNRLAEMVIG